MFCSHQRQFPGDASSVIKIKAAGKQSKEMCMPNCNTILMSQPGNGQQGRSNTGIITFLSNSAVKKTVDADSSADVFFFFPAFLSLHLLTRSSGL